MLTRENNLALRVLGSESWRRRTEPGVKSRPSFTVMDIVLPTGELEDICKTAWITMGRVGDAWVGTRSIILN